MAYQNAWLNQWVHFCQVQNSKGISLYVNGSLYSLLTTSVNSETSDNTRIGIFTGASDPALRPLNGKLDDIRVFNRALSPSEIQTLYHESGW